MEALIFMFDVACMTYVCWRIYKRPIRRPTGLGCFQYRVHEQHPPRPAMARSARGGEQPAGERRGA